MSDCHEPSASLGRTAPKPSPPTLSIVGCGNVGRVLARLWHQQGVFQVCSVLNRSTGSGQRAIDCIGAGQAVGEYREVEPADVLMIATPDEAIETSCRQACQAGAIMPGAVVFHTSGSLGSQLLEPARRLGAVVASVHPVKSFADPDLSVETFSGTFAAIEGDPAACRLLEEAMVSIGAKPFAVCAEFKTIYHAATVTVSNYLVALIEVGLRCMEKSGIDRSTGTDVIAPILKGTLRNVIELGTCRALTGPIARGEASVVGDQRRALAEWDRSVDDVYRCLGRVAIELAATRGAVPPTALAAIREILDQER